MLFATDTTNTNDRPRLHRRWVPLIALALVVAGFGADARSAEETANQRPPNVLLIIFDDLRTEPGCYGGQAITPHIDRLAEEGIRFDRAYCQYPLCNPSRLSFLTGMRPNTLGVFNNEVKLKDVRPDLVTLPEYFKNHGYHTARCFKEFHHRDAHPEAWSDPIAPKAKTPPRRERAAVKPKRATASRAAGPAESPNTYSQAAKEQKAAIVEMLRAEGADEQTLREYERPYGKLWGPLCFPQRGGPEYDHLCPAAGTAGRAIQQLETFGDRPFLLAVGFHEPHIPWPAPERFYDLYQLDELRLPETRKRTGHPGGELSLDTASFRKGNTPAETEQIYREAIRGYLAATSFADAQIGRLLERLEELGMKDNTIIVLWSDHGYHLGEHGHWGKGTLFEESLRVPLIVAGPGIEGGKTAESIVELIDIFPTLCELTGLPPAPNLEGMSFGAVLRDPSLAGKAAAFSQIGAGPANCVTMARHRYIEHTEASVRWMKDRLGIPFHGREVLFDLENDPAESRSVAGRENLASVEASLRQLLATQKMGDK